ncbi:hypothetical protein [Pedobacter sp.]|uniref:hypothetical protein n=1 Tax=Pedobacter sp. TaxID=1411316 RepID=UPI003BA9C2A6
MENQDKKLSPKPSDDAQSLVETIIPSTATEESKTTEVKHDITLEMPQTPVDKKEDKSNDSEKVNQEEDKKTEAKSENDTDDVESENDESKDDEDSEEEVGNSETDEPAEDKKDGEDEGDKIETVAP